MQQSAFAALGSVVAAVVTFLVLGPTALSASVGLVAAAASALWISHVFIFAVKAIQSRSNSGAVRDRRDALKLFGSAVAFAAIGYSFPSIGFAAGMPAGYQLQSCCRFGCGGACCRCGAAFGYLSDCSTDCGVGIVQLRAMPKDDSIPSLRVTGRLVDAAEGSALPSEIIQVTVPGGHSYFAKSDSEGRFVLDVAGVGEKPHTVSLGTLKSVSAANREVGEDKNYHLFLRAA
jgi:hypothetical protein